MVGGRDPAREGRERARDGDDHPTDRHSIASNILGGKLASGLY
jgi:hypothetical protein